MDADESIALRGLLAPVEGLDLVLPNSMVLQILAKADTAPYENAPPWLLGTTLWQKRKVPALAFEVAAGFSMRPPGRAGLRLAIVKTLNHADKIPFYALVLSATPRPVNLDQRSLQVADNAVPASPLVHSQVLVHDKPAGVPNLDALEQMLISQLGVLA